MLESLNRSASGKPELHHLPGCVVRPEWRVVIANAGHLPPYLNTQEVALPGGLPLGVFQNKYDEVRLYLHPGDAC